MRKGLVICIITVLFIIFSESVSYGFAMNIGPPSIELVLKPRETKTGIVRVSNNGQKNIGVNAYIQDWLYNSDGSKSFFVAGTTPFSCAKWLGVFPKKFQLEAGQTMNVQYTITAPEDAVGGYCSVIFFESFPIGEESEEAKGMTVQFAGRLGSIVYVEIEKKSVHKGSIESLSVTPPQSDKPFELAMAFKNTGNTHIAAQGTLNIIDDKGNVFGKERTAPLNTLPGDTREAKIEWLGELEEGSYIALLTLEIGAEQPIVEERKFNVSIGGAISSFSIDATKERPLFSVLVKNAGHLNIDVGGGVELLDKNTQVVGTVSLGNFLIAPGKEKTLEGTFDEYLPPGSYTAKAVIFIGNKKLVKEEVFSIK